MEKQTSTKLPPNHQQQQQQQQQLSPQDWESLIDDFQSSVPSRRSRWAHLPLSDLVLTSLLRRDFPVTLKPHLLLFLESHFPSTSLTSLLDALRSFLQSPSEPPPLKEQFLVSATSIVITSVDLTPDTDSDTEISSLVETLLTVANRPNHGPDRNVRAVACECLRELELSYPLLLSDAIGHLFSLAQSERTHASQSYALLLADVINNAVTYGLLSNPNSILQTSSPLIPFAIPQCAYAGAGPDPAPASKPSDLNLRDIRKVMSFLLERPQALAPPATAELVSTLIGIAGALEQHVPAVAALLKVQFSGLVHSYDPILCHVLLTVYSRFQDSFTGEDDLGIARRLSLIPKEAYRPLVFRLLALHWLLGSPRLKKETLTSLGPSFYPVVFDPLSLKAAKLDAMACVAAGVDSSGGEDDGPMVKLFEDGLVCVSGFKWLPPWSTETVVAFRTLHKFLIGVAPHRGDGMDGNALGDLVESTIFRTLKSTLVKLALEHSGLVPVIANFVDRLLRCKAHQQVGEELLQTFDEHLLPKLEPDYRLTSYFPIFERIAENDTVPPCGLLELLMRHMVFLTEKHGPDTGLRSWSQGSKILGLCRSMLMHHHSSRVFHALSCLLVFACHFFPDLEVRDNARIYLRMLVCIPGQKLRRILTLGEQIPGVSASPHPDLLFQVSSPRLSQDTKKSLGVSSYIHLDRVVPLLVKQSWSITLPNSGMGSGEASYFDGIGDFSENVSTSPSEQTVTEGEVSFERQRVTEGEVGLERISYPHEPLRVMDSKVAEIVEVLRKHFACIPDYRHMPGIKIRIPCILRFESEQFTRIWGVDSSALGSDDADGLPALYATTITFSSTAKYGSIPPCRVPFLLGEPPKTGFDIVPMGNDVEIDSNFRALVTVELEPREPMPGLIDVAIKANVENGQIISGSLQSITVGIEDIFLRASIPPDVTEDWVHEYYMDLFHALWEACGSCANTGRETFPLSGGKGAAAISGTRSVKLLDVSSDSLINAIEGHLAPFIVSVSGQPLMSILKENGVIRDVVWEDESENVSAPDVNALVPYSEDIPLQLQYVQDESDNSRIPDVRKRSMGTVLVLIFLPPRFHLLFQMEVGEVSTLVRIRTDHWPCLAYVDEYLEALFLT